MNLDDGFHALVAATAVGVPLVAGLRRGRQYAIFGAVLLALSLPGAVVTHARVAGWWPAIEPAWTLLSLWGLLALAVHMVHLTRARLRGAWFRWAISVPGQVFLAAGAFSGVWQLALWPGRALLGALELDGVLRVLQPLDLIPLAIAVASVGTSFRLVEEVVRVRLGKDGPTETARVPVERHRGSPPPLAERPLRVAQITDPHLGPWQSVAELREVVAGLVAREPDLILLTGDFLTMEGRGTPAALGQALRPLRDAPGRCFAIFGNHDHEAPEVVRQALHDNGVDLLVDEERRVETPVGPVQLLGADWVWRGREAHLHGLLERFPRIPGHLRLLMLHDPLGFHVLPDGEADLVLSGHTHGGQVGLVSLGLDWTVLSRSRWPDHGLFARGANRLYVHRGTGFYGFPLRVGVPGEASVLEIYSR